MEHLISQIEAYADRRGIKPSTVLQYAAGLGGNAWSGWKGGAQCTIATAEKVKKYMMENPPVESGSGSLACVNHVATAPEKIKGGAE